MLEHLDYRSFYLISNKINRASEQFITKIDVTEISTEKGKEKSMLIYLNLNEINYTIIKRFLNITKSNH